jgi:hypothetical protein
MRPSSIGALHDPVRLSGPGAGRAPLVPADGLVIGRARRGSGRGKPDRGYEPASAGGRSVAPGVSPGNGTSAISRYANVAPAGRRTVAGGRRGAPATGTAQRATKHRPRIGPRIPTLGSSAAPSTRSIAAPGHHESFTIAPIPSGGWRSTPATGYHPPRLRRDFRNGLCGKLRILIDTAPCLRGYAAVNSSRCMR